MSTETLRILLSEDVLAALRDSAASERRPLNWQAEVLLRRALDLPFPTKSTAPLSDENHPVCALSDAA